MNESLLLESSLFCWWEDNIPGPLLPALAFNELTLYFSSSISPSNLAEIYEELCAFSLTMLGAIFSIGIGELMLKPL